MSQMFALLWLLLSIISVYSQQEMIMLKPMNRCLGNCAVCANDDLTTCSGKEMQDCVKGYSGNNCMPKDIYAV